MRWVRVILGCFLAAAGTASAERAPVLDGFPADRPADQEAVYAAFNRSPASTVFGFVDSLTEGKGKEAVTVQYALDGWTTFVLRPGAGVEERAALAEALGQAITRTRESAPRSFLLEQLGRVGVQASVPLLGRLLADPTWAQRASLALQAFALPAYAEDVWPFMERALPGSTGHHRDVLLQLLGDAPPPDVIHRIRADLEAPGQTRQHLALRAAALTGDPDLAEMFRLDEAIPYFSDYVAQLARRGHDALALQLCRQWISPSEPEASDLKACIALIALVDLRGNDAFPDLAAAWDHPGPAARTSARNLLAASNVPQVAPWLVRRLDDANPVRRAEALTLLVHRRDPVAGERGRTMIEDESADVRRAAFEACAALGGPTATDHLLAVYTGLDKGDRAALLSILLTYQGVSIADQAHALTVGSPDPKTEAAMLEVIGACMARAYIEDALSRVRSSNAALAKQAVKTLKRLAGPAEIDALLALILDANLAPTLRSSLAPVLVAALNEAPGKERAAPVRNLLPESTGDMRHDLHRVLSGLETEEAVALLLGDTSHPEATTRDSAVRALCAWNGFEAAPPLLETARATTNETHNALALQRLLQLVQQYRVTDDEEGEHRNEARAMYEAALTVAQRDEEKILIRDALAGLVLEPDTPEDDASR